MEVSLGCFLLLCSVMVTHLAQQIRQQGAVPWLPCTSIIVSCSGHPQKRLLVPTCAHLYHHKQQQCGTVAPSTRPLGALQLSLRVSSPGGPHGASLETRREAVLSLMAQRMPELMCKWLSMVVRKGRKRGKRREKEGQGVRGT